MTNKERMDRIHSRKSVLNPLVFTKGALLYGVTPVCALCEAEYPGHLNVRAVLRHFVPNKGLHPLRRYAAILADLVSRNGFANHSR